MCHIAGFFRRFLWQIRGSTRSLPLPEFDCALREEEEGEEEDEEKMVDGAC